MEHANIFSKLNGGYYKNLAAKKPRRETPQAEPRKTLVPSERVMRLGKIPESIGPIPSLPVAIPRAGRGMTKKMKRALRGALLLHDPDFIEEIEYVMNAYAIGDGSEDLASFFNTGRR